MYNISCNIATSSNIPIPTNCPKSSATSRYAEYIKGVYERSPVSNDGKFPPTPSEKYVNLAVVKYDDRPRDLDELKKHTLHGRVNDLLVGKTKISIDEIVRPTDSLVFVEGPPGMGKSTLAWELCRRCDELPSMRQYSLVVLHRFRDKKVQEIENPSGLFPHPFDGDLQQSVIKEVLANNGKGILFILDGFDELPVRLRRDGFLKELIQGHVFPNCTVLVTSIPSATGDFMRLCSPQITRHVEILGFTEECVKEYAYSVFSSQPEMLEGFLTYISASENPAINNLMYVPLNAAIVVEIYRNSWSAGCPIPRTLTQLYTQLCLILVQRFLKAMHPSDEYILNKFSDIPEKYQDDFLNLSKVAFEGFKNNEVIFHSLPKNVVHFGFLNTDSALYSSGISHNFLHLTFQEFLAAYYISQLPHSLDLWMQYSDDSRWDVVWVFVSGLTHFQSFKECNNIERFANINEEYVFVKELLIDCIFEAQVPVFDYHSFFKTTKLITPFIYIKSPLNGYALGYCIANSSPNTRWSLELSGGSPDSLMWGLNSTKNNCCGIIAEMIFSKCSFSMELFKQFPISILENIHHLQILFRGGKHVGDMVHLEDVIPLCKKLSSLVLDEEEINARFFNKLCDSNVSNLVLRPFKFTSPSTSKHLDFLAAMAKLIHSSSGNLRSLTLYLAYSDVSYDVKEFYDLLFASSSLHKLELYSNSVSISSSLHLLETNSSLTDVTIECDEIRSCSQSIVNILQRNNVLQRLSLSRFYVPDDVDILRVIITALQGNTVLKVLIIAIQLPKVPIGQYISPSQYMKENYSHLNLDSRVMWVDRLLFSW